VGHVEQGTRCVPLYSHILRLGESCQWDQRTRLGDLSLVFVYESADLHCARKAELTMCGEVSNTSHGITLHLDVRRQHLPNQWL
jgi:hypothetical protein